jgi:internalin A
MTREELLKIIAKAKRDGQTKLDLSAKLIQELPSEIGQLTNLRTLLLNGNHLKVLPDEIKHLRNLTTLNLNFNRLTLKDEIKQLRSLTSLGLNGNQLTTLPDAIGQLTQILQHSR